MTVIPHSPLTIISFCVLDMSECVKDIIDNNVLVSVTTEDRTQSSVRMTLQFVWAKVLLEMDLVTNLVAVNLETPLTRLRVQGALGIISMMTGKLARLVSGLDH